LPVLPKAIAVATATSKDKGMFVILIHPNKIDDKLAFEQQFVAAVRPFSWFGSIKDYGYFWAARDEVQVAVSAITGTSAAITVTAPKSVSGLTLELPEAWHLAKSSSLIRSQGTGYAVLNQVTGTVKLSLMHD
jgi:sRNA-binding carbon storage regulator CsrA